MAEPPIWTRVRRLSRQRSASDVQEGLRRLRYGENPHQKAALYGTFARPLQAAPGQGAFSYNNILDITSATYLIGEFERPTVAILKHTNPCGVASAETLLEAWEKAVRDRPAGPLWRGHRRQPHAGRRAGRRASPRSSPRSSSPRAFTTRRWRSLRGRRTCGSWWPAGAWARMRSSEVRSVVGGVLVQDRDRTLGDRRVFKVVTKRQPTPEEWDSMLFGWKVCKHVKSNAIVYAAASRPSAIGAGQMARVDSSRIAVWKAGEAGLDLRDSVVVPRGALPVRRRAYSRCAGGRHRGHPARRFGARRGGHRRGRRARHGDGVHRDPALQALRPRAGTVRDWQPAGDRPTSADVRPR
jgi:phosphoribosylaminoimidazolecarboxamide formyltransferase/IMP cyclohydrolase